MAVKIQRALISVSNKEGIISFARILQNHGVEIISTGGTYNQIQDSGIKVLKVEEITGFPEMLNGRLKTLHPFIHGGILADRANSEHMKQISDTGIKLIDMVVVNLYPFRETVSRPGVRFEEAIEDYERVLELDDEDIEALIGMGMAYVNLEKYKKAIECIQKALKLDPDHEQANELLNKVKELEELTGPEK